MPGVPLLANMTEFGRTPFFTASEFEAMGYTHGDLAGQRAARRQQGAGEALRRDQARRRHAERWSITCRPARSSTPRSAITTMRRWTPRSLRPSSRRHAATLAGPRRRAPPIPSAIENTSRGCLPRRALERLENRLEGSGSGLRRLLNCQQFPVAGAAARRTRKGPDLRRLLRVREIARDDAARGAIEHGVVQRKAHGDAGVVGIGFAPGLGEVALQEGDVRDFVDEAAPRVLREIEAE